MRGNGLPEEKNVLRSFCYRTELVFDWVDWVLDKYVFCKAEFDVYELE